MAERTGQAPRYRMTKKHKVELIFVTGGV